MKERSLLDLFNPPSPNLDKGTWLKTPGLPIHLFRNELRQRHLEQLRTARPLLTGPQTPWPQLPGTPSPYEQLLEWSTQAKEQIASAIAKR